MIFFVHLFKIIYNVLCMLSLLAEDMIICLEAFSKEGKLVDGDVVEIKATEEQTMKLFLKVKELSLELQQKGAPLSIAADVAQTFGLVAMKTVTVKKVKKEVCQLLSNWQCVCCCGEGMSLLFC
jgi:hypothetical protein